MCSEMIKLVRMFNSVEEVDNEMMSGLFKSCGQLMVPKGRLMRRSVIDLAVSYREQKEASFELNTLALEPSEEEKSVERALKANGYERLPIDIHHKTKNNAKHKSKRSYCTDQFPHGAPGTFLWVRHGYGDAITDIHIPQCGFQFKSFDHEYVVFEVFERSITLLIHLLRGLNINRAFLLFLGYTIDQHEPRTQVRNLRYECPRISFCTKE